MCFLGQPDNSRHCSMELTFPSHSPPLIPSRKEFESSEEGSAQTCDPCSKMRLALLDLAGLDPKQQKVRYFTPTSVAGTQQQGDLLGRIPWQLAACLRIATANKEELLLLMSVAQEAPTGMTVMKNKKARDSKGNKKRGGCDGAATAEESTAGGIRNRLRCKLQVGLGSVALT